VAVASAGPYASLHLAPDRYPRQHPTTQFFTGRMPFLPPNQQRQSTEGSGKYIKLQFKMFNFVFEMKLRLEVMDVVTGWHIWWKRLNRCICSTAQIDGDHTPA